MNGIEFCEVGSESVITKIVFLHSVLKNTGHTSWSASALTFTHVLSYSNFPSGRDGINIAVTIVTDLVQS